MAIYNEILAGRFARGIQKLFSIKGEVPTKQLSGEIMAMHPLGSGVENRTLEGWDRFGVAVAAPAGGAGNRSGIRLRNPVGSNVIAVIEKITFYELAAVADAPLIFVGAQTLDLTTIFAVTNQIRFDARGRANSTLIISDNSGATGVGGLPPAVQWQGTVASSGQQDVILFEDQEFPVAPGDALTLFSNVLNQAMNASVFWRERILEESERTGG